MKLTDNPMFDLWPSCLEVQAAKAVFLERVKHYAPDVEHGQMSQETLMACALAEVWRQGRRYQRDHAGPLELSGMEVVK